MNFSAHLICLVVFIMEVLLVSSASNKPPGMSQGIYCECCSATVKELTKKLEKKTSDSWEVKVIEAMEDICNVKNFGSYDYSPPTTIKACKYIMDKYDEDVENVLIEKESEPEKKVCYEITKACEGVDRSKKEKEEMDVRINDKKQEVNKQPDDGIQRMNVDINDPNSAKLLAEQIKQQMAQQPMGGGGDAGDDDEDEEEEDESEHDDGDEGNERSVKKPKDDDAKDDNAKDDAAKDDDAKDDDTKDDDTKDDDTKDDATKDDDTKDDAAKDDDAKDEDAKDDKPSSKQKTEL